MTQNNISLSGKEVLAQQWYLTRLCFRTAPGSMALHLFESVKLQISIFFEFTWCINYVLEAAENRAPWTDILLCMGILLAAIAVSTASFAFYMQKALPKLKPMLYRAFRMEIYTRTKDMDLSCYDDTDFYQKFILSAQEADACIDRYLSALELCQGPTPVSPHTAKMPGRFWQLQSGNPKNQPKIRKAPGPVLFRPRCAVRPPASGSRNLVSAFISGDGTPRPVLCPYDHNLQQRRLPRYAGCSLWSQRSFHKRVCPYLKLPQALRWKI